jgi:hypothetical protein
MKISTSLTVSMLSLALLLTAPAIGASQERVGTSCADCPDLRAAFSIENATGITLHYQVKWGQSREWKSTTLVSGHVMKHSYPLDAGGKAPAPYIRYDSVGGDGAAFTAQEYHLQFHAIGYAGYGPAANTSTAKQYVFRFAADGRTLELRAR